MPTTYAIPNGRTVMDATLWTGDGNTSRSITNATSFKPDLVWIKERDISISHLLYNSIVGAGVNKALSSNNTNSEADGNNNSTYGYLDSFSSSGFSVQRGSDGSVSYTNKNTGTYVAWQWQAGQGTTSSNTNGSVTSTVSVNQAAGFSIVTYTSPSGGATAYTVGHGLGVAPSLVISKERNAVGIWSVYHVSTGATRLQLQDTGTGTSNVWTTLPTSTTFWQGSSYADGSQRVAYCWAPVAGFSQFGSYTGNGSTDGPFIYTGFKPRWIMIKSSSLAGYEWYVYDTARQPYNVAQTPLFPNQSSAESANSAFNIDILSNGFKCRATYAGNNNNGSTYIYAAFAENPFKYANAS